MLNHGTNINVNLLFGDGGDLTRFIRHFGDFLKFFLLLLQRNGFLCLKISSMELFCIRLQRK